MRNSSQPTFVYFLKPVGFFGPIKIGCSEFPIQRLKTLMAWSPFELELLATAEGGVDLERNLHECFFDLHLRGEWFRPGKELLTHLRLIGCDVDAFTNVVPAHFYRQFPERMQ